MNIKFRGKTIEVINQSKRENVFTSDWNEYKIRFRHYKDSYKIRVISPKNEELLNKPCANISQALNLSFNAIDGDIAEMEYMKANKLLLIASTNGKFAEEIKRAEAILDKIEY